MQVGLEGRRDEVAAGARSAVGHESVDHGLVLLVQADAQRRERFVVLPSAGRAFGEERAAGRAADVSADEFGKPAVGGLDTREGLPWPTLQSDGLVAKRGPRDLRPRTTHQGRERGVDGLAGRAGPFGRHLPTAVSPVGQRRRWRASFLEVVVTGCLETDH